MKVFITRGFDLDELRDANPHLRIELIDATSATPFCTIMPKPRKDKTVFCVACTATVKNRSTGERFGWTIFRSSNDSALCTACTRAREAKLKAGRA